jgi:hypothetical protein
MTPRPPNHADIGAKLDALHSIVIEVRDEVKDLSAMKPDLAEFLELYRPARGAVKVGKWIGRMVIWLGAIIAAVAAATAAVKGLFPK